MTWCSPRGAAAESYLDTGNRGDFDNGPVIAAHPAFASVTANEIWLAQACAAQCRQGPVLAAIRARLAARAGTVVHPQQAAQIIRAI